MARSDIRRYSLDEINAMRARGEAHKTPNDAPEIALDETFWKNAKIVETKPRKKASVHLRIEPETLEFFRSAGPGHLTRMAKVLKAYAEAHAKR
jgi:uncharacterized protein (DUF4415 family)